MARQSERDTRAAPFALRVVQRTGGLAAIVYRRRVNDRMDERFDRVAAISPLGHATQEFLIQQGLEGDKAKGPPGASWMTRKEMKVIPMRSGIASTSRRRAKRAI